MYEVVTATPHGDRIDYYHDWSDDLQEGLAAGCQLMIGGFFLPWLGLYRAIQKWRSGEKADLNNKYSDSLLGGCFAGVVLFCFGFGCLAATPFVVVYSSWRGPRHVGEEVPMVWTIPASPPAS
jgi:hypothetical protein